MLTLHQATLPEDRCNVLDEILERAWRSGEGDVEAVQIGLSRPRLELIGDLLGRTSNDAQIVAQQLAQFTKGSVLRDTDPSIGAMSLWR